MTDAPVFCHSTLRSGSGNRQLLWRNDRHVVIAREVVLLKVTRCAMPSMFMVPTSRVSGTAPPETACARTKRRHSRYVARLSGNKPRERLMTRALRSVAAGKRPKPPRADAGREQTFQNSARTCEVEYRAAFCLLPMTRQKFVQDPMCKLVHLASGLRPMGAGRVQSLGCDRRLGGRRR